MPWQGEIDTEGVEEYGTGGTPADAGRHFTSLSRPELDYLSNPEIPQHLLDDIQDYLPFVQKMSAFGNLSPIRKARVENALFRAQLYNKMGMKSLAAQAIVQFLVLVQTSRAIDMTYLRYLLTNTSEVRQSLRQQITQQSAQKKSWFRRR